MRKIVVHGTTICSWTVTKSSVLAAVVDNDWTSAGYGLPRLANSADNTIQVDDCIRDHRDDADGQGRHCDGNDPWNHDSINQKFGRATVDIVYTDDLHVAITYYIYFEE